MSRTDKFEATVGCIKGHVDYGTPLFHLDIPDSVSSWDLVGALRLISDLGFRIVDLREYAPTWTVKDGLRIELQRSDPACH